MNIFDDSSVRDEWPHGSGEKEHEDQAKLEALREAVRAGEESGIAEGDVIAEVRQLIRRRASATPQQ